MSLNPSWIFIKYLWKDVEEIKKLDPEVIVKMGQEGSTKGIN